MTDAIQDANRCFYQKYGELTASFRSNAFYLEKPFQKFVAHIPAGGQVIDIGCAHGIHVPLFLGIGRGLRYEGFDITPKFIDIARRHYPQLTFTLGNIIDKLDIPSKKYAGFWAAAIFQHVQREEWPTLFWHIERMTVSGGIGFFSVPFDRTTEVGAEDTRQFTIIPKRQLAIILQRRRWKILHYGKLDGSRRSKHWGWYIVQLP